MAKELLSRIEKRISFIRDEHTLVGIWLPENSDNSFYAEPRLEISVNNEGKLVGRALAMKAAMMKDVRSARRQSGSCWRGFTGRSRKTTGLRSERAQRIIGARHTMAY